MENEPTLKQSCYLLAVAAALFLLAARIEYLFG